MEALKLPIDKEKKFYVFIIDKDLSIEKFFYHIMSKKRINDLLFGFIEKKTL